jgi:probable HAF family extracellular repeat protein
MVRVPLGEAGLAISSAQKVLLIAVWTVGCAAPICLGQASFRGLGTVPGGIGSLASAVSADGTTVVGKCPNGVTLVAFRWTDGTGMVSLGDLPAPVQGSNATAVSSDGSVIVGMASGQRQPYRWTQATGMVAMTGMPSVSSGVAGLSGDGSVAVGALIQSPNTLAVRWTQATGPVDLGFMPGGRPGAAQALGVNADGSVIVGYGTIGTGSGTTRSAFRWTTQSGMVSLGGLPGQTFWSEANAVSSDGAAVVGDAQWGTTTHAIRWTAGPGMIDLGVIAGGGASSASAVNSDGSVIVGVCSLGGVDHAFLWTQQAGMVDLKSYLISLGATGLSGWSLDSATGISADGNTIVGTGTNPSGRQEGYYAVIPAPGSLMVLCGLGVGAARRRR